ncbi:hypothetical protein B7R22_18085 [Subtercola boreus]|uniref:Uncharacterized protein n=1 Tax=Subtercola boreus TaxID=120213 RepID=A0A3E0VPT6_9MICO|nr:hypothetical protein [Subtercola boreus]RFA11731.1 hypothetical protein B7R22_18085 [Subtercola boreus]
MEGLSTKGSFTDEGSNAIRSEVLAGIRERIADYTETRLPDMDRYGIDVQVLSLTAPGLQVQPDPHLATNDAVLANDHFASVIKTHPDRFAGF